MANLTRESIAESVSELYFSIDNGFPLLKDYKPQVSSIIIPYSTLMKQSSDGLLSCLNESMRVAKENKIDSDEALKYSLLYLNDFNKGKLNPYEIFSKAKEIRNGLINGKHNGEKLIGFWSTWDEDAAGALALFNVKFAVDKSVPVRDIIVKAQSFYKNLKKVKWQDSIGGIFVAKYLDDVIKGELNEDNLIETADKIYKTATKYPKLKWDSDEAKKLIICYSDKVAKHVFPIEKLVETASELYEQAKKKNKAINKSKWDSDTAIEISINHSGRVIEKGLKIEDIIKELDESYKFFTKTLPTEGWIFKSNEEISKSATLMYTTINHLGLEGKDLENEIVNDTISQMIEEEIAREIAMMNMIVLLTIINTTMITSSVTVSH